MANPSGAKVHETAEPFSDDEAVGLFNARVPPGLALMNAVCIAASNANRSLTFQYDLDERFLNVNGFVCGGYLANALDQAMAYAMTLVTGDPCPTLEMKTSFVAAARAGRLIATGRVVRAGRHFGFVEGTLLDAEDTLIATATATVQRLAVDRLRPAAGAE